MTLRKLKTARREPSAFSPERSKIRSLLRKASRGNALSFVLATASYSNLVSEYLYVAGITSHSRRMFEVQRVLSDCWRYLPYTRRVSDFERFLQVRLERYPLERECSFAGEHLPLNELTHEERFLLVARIFGGWSHKSLRLALRLSKRELSEALMSLKCKLVGFRLDTLKASELAQVLRVSELLEGELTDKQARHTEKELRECYHAHQFKADWLSYRCELADLRLSMCMTEADQNELSERISQLIRQQPMEKPGFTDSVINQFSFVRVPTP
ncbi:hypothetical protein [Pelagicoccus sp. SDUM812003]|uniref:hypothetical protein n=1 Tax=Pelagicoccus sp. SDUM812003 TaxID=3041267 RepID=UPI0028104A5D|nr:hypothetical protein [Pelagicoccus sp. SDUM812003]MDQ8205418.1 hypothetical protein [Pelagicoccus sp. SDUM812003]